MPGDAGLTIQELAAERSHIIMMLAVMVRDLETDSCEEEL